MNNVMNLEVLGLEELGELEVLSIDGGWNDSAYGAGASVGRGIGKVLGGVALLAFFYF